MIESLDHAIWYKMFRGKNTKRQKQIYLLNNTFLCYVRVKSSLCTILFPNIVKNRYLYNTDMRNIKVIRYNCRICFIVLHYKILFELILIIRNIYQNLRYSVGKWCISVTCQNMHLINCNKASLGGLAFDQPCASLNRILIELIITRTSATTISLPLKC